jgi:tetratricopeptide (TPR) repeat protein
LVPANAPSEDAADDGRATAEELVAQGFALARQDNWVGAIRLYKEAIEKNPELNKAYGNLGFALNHLGQYEEALKVINKGLEYHEHAALYSSRAFSNKNLTRYDAAIADYDKALELGGTDYKNCNKAKADCLLELGETERAYSTVLYGLRFDPRNDGLLSLKSRIERARPEILGR